jgi:hypothetical protein
MLRQRNLLQVNSTSQRSRTKPQPSEEVQVKEINLGTGDSSKTTMIGAGLDPK